MRGHWKRWLIVGIVVLVVLVVGGPFVYFHFIQGSAPAPLTLPSTTRPAAGSGADRAAAPVDGVWNVTSGSQAGYRVEEILFGQSGTAVGRTSAVTGTMSISGTTVTSASFSADMTQVSSDQSVRDQQFQGRIMDTSRYPRATFVLGTPIELGSVPAEGAQVQATASGQLTLHGTTRDVTFPVSARRDSHTVSVSGTIPITFADYGIGNPSFAGVTETQDHGVLEFLLVFSPA